MQCFSNGHKNKGLLANQSRNILEDSNISRACGGFGRHSNYAEQKLSYLIHYLDDLNILNT